MFKSSTLGESGETGFNRHHVGSMRAAAESGKIYCSCPCLAYGKQVDAQPYHRAGGVFGNRLRKSFVRASIPAARAMYSREPHMLRGFPATPRLKKLPIFTGVFCGCCGWAIRKSNMRIYVRTITE